jgi:hypothetical protein
MCILSRAQLRPFAEWLQLVFFFDSYLQVGQETRGANKKNPDKKESSSATSGHMPNTVLHNLSGMGGKFIWYSKRGRPNNAEGTKVCIFLRRPSLAKTGTCAVPEPHAFGFSYILGSECKVIE